MKVFTAVVPCLLSVTNAAYTLQKDFCTKDMSFFDSFTFFNDLDPTNGPVNYVDRNTATNLKLISSQNGQIYMGVDYNSTLSAAQNRSAVRIEGNDLYTHGLFITDLAHMPGGICGTWPAWWLLGDTSTNPAPSDPAGEIDIIENSNDADINTSTLWAYKKGTCSTKDYGSQMIGSLIKKNAKASSVSCHGNEEGVGGCEVDDSRIDSFGTTFNSEGGGVYALEWTSTFIKVFFFPRSGIPTNATGPLGSSPDPTTWGKPAAIFGGGCDLDSYFRQLHMIFNITFCGDAASGDNWKSNPVCSKKAATCEAYIRENPADFKNAYWLLNSVKVFKQP